MEFDFRKVQRAKERDEDRASRYTRAHQGKKKLWLSEGNDPLQLQEKPLLKILHKDRLARLSEGRTYSTGISTSSGSYSDSVMLDNSIARETL